MVRYTKAVLYFEICGKVWIEGIVMRKKVRLSLLFWGLFYISCFSIVSFARELYFTASGSSANPAGTGEMIMLEEKG